MKSGKTTLLHAKSDEVLFMDKVYVIFNDRKLDLKEIIGVIVGDEETAKKYCEDYNADCNDQIDEVWFEELKVLNDQSKDEYGEWIEVGD